MSGIALTLLLMAIPVAFTMFVVLNFGGLLTWVERKQSAIMQDRIGANRASIFGIRVLGLLHPLADAVKMLTKEDFMPARADRLLFTLAPFVSVFFALAAFASIPFGDTLTIAGRKIQLQAVPLNVGILYVLGMLSLGVYGLMMAGWSSANNYALLGGQRAAALMISAEIAIGASIMGVVIVQQNRKITALVNSGRKPARGYCDGRLVAPDRGLKQPAITCPCQQPTTTKADVQRLPAAGSRSTAVRSFSGSFIVLNFPLKCPTFSNVTLITSLWRAIRSAHQGANRSIGRSGACHL